MTNIIEVNQLTKSFGSATTVNDVSFTIEEGKIYGLLGRNGAGKTTIMNMITAQLFPTSGEIKVFGEAPYENQSVLRQICFIKEGQQYPHLFRIADVLDLCPSLFPNWDNEYAYSLLEEYKLPVKRKIKKLSRGMLSSVGIVIGLASRAPLTIFDEPYLGLDAVARGIFYDRLLEDYAKHPRTIILSTHLIDEVSRMLEHVLLLDQGKLIINEEVDAIRGRAYTAIGSAKIMDSFMSGKQILHQESMGSIVSTTVFEPLDKQTRMEAEELGLEITPVSLQQLIIHLTNNTPKRKVDLNQ
ncbi:ABC transporter ATP-binding protein [Fictibacillus fluitans]|uniref:ABC transporter ATP-binding protein n=1 Tax=Fictibacillus fluitans TaxID=3058422 RepID=A0ABT8HZ44_9BACL|nr:ABC transporter ATP-binding protein [Fictibacillus sp. NE201]MDN4525979.1 ABC transporter ATP-binding protein [Fictibacillus sp. NE201]